MGSTRRSAIFVSFIDLCFVGAFIAAVYELRGISKEKCSHFNTGSFYVSLGPFGYFGHQSNSGFAANINTNCTMLKACFAFGIMNIIFFFITFLLAAILHRHERRETVVRETRTTRRRSHGSRRGHSHSGGSRHRSSRRSYVV